MTDSPPLPPPSWPFSIAKLCLIAQRSVAFWQPWISQVSRHCERSFKRILSHEPLRPFHQAGCGIVWASDFIVIDVDGTKQAARQRALPSSPEFPAPHRRFDQVCAPAYLGRKRGEVARTRTTVLQAHSHHWLGSFGGPGNGDYRGELARALEAIISYAGWLCMPLSQILVRLDGLYGNAAVLSELVQSGLGGIVRSKDYGMLDLPAVQARLRQLPDRVVTHPESGASRARFDCLDIPLLPAGPRIRLIVATHRAISTKKPSIGILRAGTVYELFFTTA